MNNMKKYEAPKIHVISRNDLDIICTSLVLPEIDLNPKSADETGDETEGV